MGLRPALDQFFAKSFLVGFGATPHGALGFFFTLTALLIGGGYYIDFLPQLCYHILMKFTHLYTQSEYSLMRGACRIGDIAPAAITAGQEAVALTDRMSMFGSVAFARSCDEAGVRPIIGCEMMYATSDKPEWGEECYPLVLLCGDEEGYANLVRMVSRGCTDPSISSQCVPLSMLQSHAAGLVAICGGAECLAARLTEQERREEAEEHLCRLATIFGEDFYLGLDAADPENAAMMATFGEKLNIQHVAIGGVQYIQREDAIVQAMLTAIGEKEQLDSSFGDNRYFRSTEEMQSALSAYPAAIANTQVVAEKCRFAFDFTARHLPKFPLPDGEKASTHLKKLCEEGIERLTEKGEIPAEGLTIEDYRMRMVYELLMIDRMGFPDYFLVVHDFVAWAKENRIATGPGRGSGAGSLVAYLLGITQVDSLRYGLLFERFLNPERLGMPDFDIDFCHLRRDEVVEYVRRKYGREHVAHIAAFGTFAARASVRDVGRVLGLSYADVDRVAKAIPYWLGIKLERALEEPEFGNLYKSDGTVRRLVDMAQRLEGMPRHVTTHAAGVVVTSEPLDRHLPLTSSGDAWLTHFDKDAVEALGFLKFDFLGLRYLTVTTQAADMVRQHDPDFDLDALSEDDATYAMLAAGHTDGIFQLESPGMRRLLGQMGPRCLTDLMSALALYRPGPADSIPEFIKNRGNPAGLSYALPALEEILSPTAGCIIYQEQVMQILRQVAGYSYGKADIIRREMAKRRSSIETERAGFVASAVKNNPGELDAEGATQLFDRLMSFAGYAFNKSHAAAYAMVTYRCAYLKANHPAEYMAALLSSLGQGHGKLPAFLADCKRLEVAILPPHINRSSKDFTVHTNAQGNKGILFGFSAIKHLGDSFIGRLETERTEGRFTDFADFVTRMLPTKAQAHALICAGAFDSLGISRGRLLAVHEDAVERVTRMERNSLDGQVDMFGETADAGLKLTYPATDSLSPAQAARLQQDVLGVEVTATPVGAKLPPHTPPVVQTKGADTPLARDGGIQKSSPPQKDTRRLFLKIDQADSPLHNNAVAILAEAGTGEVTVSIYHTSTEKYTPHPAKVALTDRLLAELEGVLGKECVVVRG